MKRQKSLRQQAKELQISPSYLSMLLSGQRQPNPGLRDKLCSLGVFTDKANLSLRGRCPRPLDECATLAGDPGFEPGLTGPEPAVLPLD
jgi:transcriptional regulator with XRE-family HTH domain